MNLLAPIARTLEYDRAENLKLARSIPEAVCDQRPAGLVQSPCWIVCHLCLADTLQHDSLTSNTPQLDKIFFAEFGPESDTSRARELMSARFGSWSDAIEAAAASHSKLVDAIRGAELEHLLAPHPNDRVREWFPTLADNIAYAVWHEGNHGGQLRAWIHAAKHADLLGAD